MLRFLTLAIMCPAAAPAGRFLNRDFTNSGIRSE
jgi:hypothetical protein